MLAGRSRWRRVNAGEVLAYAVAVGVALLYVLHRLPADFGGLRPFWDAHVYARALREWRSGLDPYGRAHAFEPEADLPFVSPPLFLYLMGGLSRLVPGRAGFVLYCCVAGACTLAVPTLIAVFYVRSRWLAPSLAVLVTWFQPGKHGSQALLTGNLSNILYAALLAAGVPGVRRNRWLPFYAVVVFAGLMKPPFLGFLVLPVLAGEGQWMRSLGAVVVVLAGDLAQRAAAPGVWAAFQRGVLLRVFAQGDTGFGLLGQVTALQGHVPVLRPVSAMVVAGLVIAPLSVLLFVLRKRRFGRPAERLWAPCLLVLAVLSNPRMLDYDANVAVVPAVFAAVEFLLSLPPSSYRGLQIGVPLTVFLGVESMRADLALCLLLVASVAMVICQLVWPGYFGRGTGDEPRELL